MDRRHFLRSSVISTVAAALPALGTSQTVAASLTARPLPAERRFRSAAIEAAIDRIARTLPSRKLATTFANCLPNTLDTTVFTGGTDAAPDTFVITGDIDAMWLRDSAAQVNPYLAFAREDLPLQRLLAGVIRRQARCVLLDPYANAFTRSPHDSPLPWAVHDKTDMRPGVAERKWEIDSLCYVIRLSFRFWKATGNTLPFDAAWHKAMQSILTTFREQQRLTGAGPYTFQRSSPSPTESLMLEGYGAPAHPNGLIFSGFRPSDDACVFPFSIAGNFFAARSLRELAEMASLLAHDSALANEATALAAQIEQALEQCAITTHAAAGSIWAYEVDGYGSALCMDDAGAPGLLSLPYLDCCSATDATYIRTRAFALSTRNPYFVSGKAASGLGSPHTGGGMVWPMGILYQALTSTDDDEILACLRTLLATDADANFMHESFQKDDATHFTRPWFAWCNSLFGEFILRLASDKPALLQAV